LNKNGREFDVMKITKNRLMFYLFCIGFLLILIMSMVFKFFLGTKIGFLILCGIVIYNILKRQKFRLKSEEVNRINDENRVKNIFNDSKNEKFNENIKIIDVDYYEKKETP
jgi:hypothetical protein